MYFVSYTTNNLELPENGWNVWEVKPNKRPPGNPPSFKIVKIFIGGKKNPDAKNISINDRNQKIVDSKREVIERIFIMDITYE